tara:strand:- start:142 stop:537 length:396 start_codon:yes stop_codon:yes gene_type:complete
MKNNIKIIISLSFLVFLSTSCNKSALDSKKIIIGEWNAKNEEGKVAKWEFTSDGKISYEGENDSKNSGTYAWVSENEILVSVRAENKLGMSFDLAGGLEITEIKKNKINFTFTLTIMNEKVEDTFELTRID